MLVHLQRKNVINAAAFLIIVSTIIIYAESGGIVGRTQKNGIGCTCHSETPSANVVVAIAGPDTLAAEQSATYTVTIQGGPLIAGGTNIAASDGDLFPIAGDLRKENFELTHSNLYILRHLLWDSKHFLQMVIVLILMGQIQVTLGISPRIKLLI